MKTSATMVVLALAGVLAAPSVLSARELSVELWTDRGNDAVYQPGDPILIKSRTSDDAYLLVYEIDAEGGVNLLFPAPGHDAAIEGRRTYRLPGGDQDELVVDQTTGQGYIVAIASLTPFDELPWYLRPVNIQAADMGYYGEPNENEEEGVTREGKIVGDPFVAMERIRRRVLKNAQDGDGFASAYASYYVHERVRYPRYLCNDCHRPGRYAWWDGWDPYYTTCSVFDFRVNWSWGWGPRYWYGTVPYFVYVYRDDCPPHYRRYAHSGVWYSAWDGWGRWCDLWGSGGLRRYKSAPPPNYTPPQQYNGDHRVRRGLPPGFIAATVEKRGGLRQGVGFGVGDESPGDDRGPRARERTRDLRDDGDRRRAPRPDQPSRGFGIGDHRPTREDRGDAPRGERTSSPGFGRSREETPTARPRESTPVYERPRQERAPERPRVESRPPRDDDRTPERPREVFRTPDPPRHESRPPERPREERAPERPKQEYKAPDPPRNEPNRSDPPRSRGDEGRRHERGNEGGRKTR